MKWILELALVVVGVITLMHAGVLAEHHSLMSYFWVSVGSVSFGFAGDVRANRKNQQTGNFAD